MSGDVCPAETELSRFVTRILPADAAASMETHLADCTDCRNLVFALASQGGDAQPASAAERIGRFEVIDLVGRGAMGAVYRARDPELDRTVAIKVRHTHGKLDVAQEDRMRREAQALARLADPHVVGVFETAVHDGKSFVVMEYVDGETLDAWLEVKRSTAAIIDLMLQAGRGLAAAHAVGLVHRDFKPTNVLVSRSGVAKVGDFGLVRLDGALDATGDDAPSDEVLTLTLSGALLGTPAYMAPEQLAGGTATEASDQFSFCVTLFEALYARRPFRGTTLRELRAAMSGPVEFPSTRRVPATVRALLSRGLATDPARRFPSMRSLLAQLERRPRRTWPLFAGAAVIAAAGATTVWASTRPAVDPCLGAEAALSGVWDPATKIAIEQKMRATDVPYAADAWHGVERTLDSYAATWTRTRRSACEATRVHHEQTEPVLALRTHCLDDRLRELHNLTTALAGADKKMVSRSVQAASRLSAISLCDDARALSETATTSSAMTALRVDQLRDEIVRGTGLTNLGKLKDGLAVIDGVVAAARREGHTAVEAQALLEQGRMQFFLDGDAERAEKTVTAALLAADQARDDYLRARAYTVLVFIVGNVQVRFDDAEKLFVAGQAVMKRLVGAESLEAQLLGNRGQLLSMQGKPDQALVMLQHTADVLERAHGPDHPEVANALAALSEVKMKLGDHDAGLALAERAYQIHARGYGPRHPETAKSLYNVGKALADQGKFVEATAKIEETVAILEGALGKDHVDLAVAIDELGIIKRHQDKFEEAVTFHRRSLALREKGLGPDHPETGISLDNLGLALGLLGKLEEAIPYHQRALAITEKAFGADNMETAASHGYLANIYWQLDRNKEAVAQFRLARDVTEKALGPDHFDLTFYLSGEAHALLDLKEPAKAVPLLERAMKLRATTTSDPVAVGELQFALARALWDSNTDRARARLLARESLPAVKDKDKPQVEKWIASH